MREYSWGPGRAGAEAGRVLQFGCNHILLGLLGFHWFVFSFTRFYWARVGFYLVLLGLIIFSWIFRRPVWCNRIRTRFLFGLNHTGGFLGFLLGFIGFHWVLLGFTCFYWVLLDFHGFYWALTGFYLDFTDLYWVVQGLPKFYLVLLSFYRRNLMWIRGKHS